MREKTKVIVQHDTRIGYANYIDFKRNFSGVINTFRKYICPVLVDCTVDVNNDMVEMHLCYENRNDDSTYHNWILLLDFLKEKKMQRIRMMKNYVVKVPIDDFVEFILRGDFD